MHILIVSATTFEVQPLIDQLESDFQKLGPYQFQKEALKIDILISGVGMILTAYSLGKILTQNKYQLAINAGIAGAFNQGIEIGTVVQVVSEQFGDLGVEEANASFTSVHQMGLIDANQAPFVNGKLHNPEASSFDFLPKVKGISVNKVHGTTQSIEKIQSYFQVDIESMEGAAFFYACLQEEIPFLQIRSISNYVEPRNKDNWDIPVAIQNLNEVLIEMVKAF